MTARSLPVVATYIPRQLERISCIHRTFRTCSTRIESRQAQCSPSQLANKIEQTFESNGFPPQWRFGLYEYPHYHSTSHEILGVFKGSARVRLGGVKCGIEKDLSAGDVMLIPAGVAHESVQSRGGFEMVGAYPAGCKWDMNYGKSQEEKQKAEANIRKVAVPTKDPVYGSKGPVLEHWQEQ